VKKLLLGILIGIAIPLVAAYLFINAGGMPVPTKGPPLPLERYIARTSIHKAMQGQTDVVCPLPADEPNLRQGARIYRAECAVCHGLPAGKPTATARGMYPRPPQLVRPDRTGVTDDPAGKVFWIAKNGIRLTGMPGYVDSLSEAELWQVSLLLVHAHELPASVQDILR